CVLDAHREYAPPENASECASTVRPSAESFLIYSASASAGNSEIASSVVVVHRADQFRRWPFAPHGTNRPWPASSLVLRQLRTSRSRRRSADVDPDTDIG